MEASGYFETPMTAPKATLFTVYVRCLSFLPAIYRGVAMFVLGPTHVGFVVEKVELGQVFFSISLFLQCHYNSKSVQ